MPERPHPERRPTDCLRPVVEIDTARRGIQKAVASETDRHNQFLNILLPRLEFEFETHLNSSSSESKEMKRLVFTETAIDRRRGWQTGLRFALGDKDGITAFFADNCDDAPTAEALALMRTRPLEEIATTRSAVSATIEELRGEKDKLLRLLTGESPERKKQLEEMRKNIQSRQDFINYKLEIGEDSPKPQDIIDFFPIQSLSGEMDTLFLAIEDERGYSALLGGKEALDWVLGADADNGLARMLAEQREKPPGR